MVTAADIKVGQTVSVIWLTEEGAGHVQVKDINAEAGTFTGTQGREDPFGGPSFGYRVFPNLTFDRVEKIF